MAGGSKQKSVLSKNVLQMKFMKRSALRIEKEQSQEERQREIDDEHWIIDLPATQQKQNKFVMEPSCCRIKDLRFGRMSFRGFNTEIEKLMTQKNLETDLASAEIREKEIGVDEEDMANRYSSLVGTISNKFKKKRQQPANNDGEDDQEDKNISNYTGPSSRKFIKPSDD